MRKERHCSEHRKAINMKCNLLWIKHCTWAKKGKVNSAAMRQRDGLLCMQVSDAGHMSRSSELFVPTQVRKLHASLRSVARMLCFLHASKG